MQQKGTGKVKEINKTIIKTKTNNTMEEKIIDITNNPYYYRKIRCDLVTLKEQHIFDEKIIEYINRVKDAIGNYIKEEWGEDYLYMDFDEETLTPTTEES